MPNNNDIKVGAKFQYVKKEIYAGTEKYCRFRPGDIFEICKIYLNGDVEFYNHNLKEKDKLSFQAITADSKGWFKILGNVETEYKIEVGQEVYKNYKPLDKVIYIFNEHKIKAHILGKGNTIEDDEIQIVIDEGFYPIGYEGVSKGQVINVSLCEIYPDNDDKKLFVEQHFRINNNNEIKIGEKWINKSNRDIWCIKEIKYNYFSDLNPNETITIQNTSGGWSQVTDEILLKDYKRLPNPGEKISIPWGTKSHIEEVDKIEDNIMWFRNVKDHTFHTLWKLNIKEQDINHKDGDGLNWEIIKEDNNKFNDKFLVLKSLKTGDKIEWRNGADKSIITHNDIENNRIYFKESSCHKNYMVYEDLLYYAKFFEEGNKNNWIYNLKAGDIIGKIELSITRIISKNDIDKKIIHVNDQYGEHQYNYDFIKENEFYLIDANKNDNNMIISGGSGWFGAKKISDMVIPGGGDKAVDNNTLFGFPYVVIPNGGDKAVYPPYNVDEMIKKWTATYNINEYKNKSEKEWHELYYKDWFTADKDYIDAVNKRITDINNNKNNIKETLASKILYGQNKK
jgi:hypothetical protein